MLGFGPFELIVILVIVLLVFGPGRLANIGGALGKTIRDFKDNVIPDEDKEIDKQKP
ncbi:MAG: twin-arginine translocase TatA/TatE family subunit [Chloroflexi bacterium]|nr:twin-arginine translocase TatA/TatE family subunit [Chloroflexota bacterium]